MTPEAQRIAIAEACSDIDYTADFLHDLNTMQEATMTLNSADKEKFIHHLMGVCRGQASAAYGVAFSDPFTSLWMGTFATAAQRAEAFLRAIGKWVD